MFKVFGFYKFIKIKSLKKNKDKIKKNKNNFSSIKLEKNKV